MKPENAKKIKLFKDSPGGIQLHAGEFRGKPVWHSDDGGKTWWSGTVFSHNTMVTSDELIQMAVSILQDTPSTTCKKCGTKLNADGYCNDMTCPC
jgi:hypothetical protein